MLPVRAELRAVPPVPEGDVAVRTAADEGAAGEVLERPDAPLVGFSRGVALADGDARELLRQRDVEDVDGALARPGGDLVAARVPREG